MENQNPQQIIVNVDNGQQNQGFQQPGIYIPPVKNQSATLVIAFFLGTLGIHDFYNGKILYGALKLIFTLTGVLFLVSWIWWIIDLVRIIKGTYTDKFGRVLNQNAAKSTKIIVAVLLILPALALPAGILAAVALPKLSGMTAKSKASVIGPAMGAYKNFQDAYVVERGDVGSWESIGYSAPSSTNEIEFREIKTNQFVGVRAQLRTNLGDCPEGTMYGFLASSGQDGSVNFVCAILDASGNELDASTLSSCEDLLPSFKRLCD